MADYPDIYADNVAVSANPFGITLTLARSSPTPDEGPDPEPEIVGRVRISHELARVMVEILSRMLAQAAQAAQASQAAQHIGSDVKH